MKIKLDTSQNYFNLNYVNSENIFASQNLQKKALLKD
jgi:hypothetical protein